MTIKLKLFLLFAMFALLLPSMAMSQEVQTEAEFRSLMPITGKVKTYFGEYELDHSFPTKESAERLYDLMDHQRATQLYLWGLPLVNLARFRYEMEDKVEGFESNRFFRIGTFNERRGVLTANESSTYFASFSDTTKGAVILDIPPGTVVGTIVDSWMQSPDDVGLFSAQAGGGGKHIIVGPNTPVASIPEPSELTDDFHVHHIKTDRVFLLGRIIGSPEKIKTLSSKMKLYYQGETPNTNHLDLKDQMIVNYQPRGLAYWKVLHRAINDEVVMECDRLFMYWLKTLGIEKGKPFNPTERQIKILADSAIQGELMAKTFVFNERLEGVLRQNNGRMVLGGKWGDGIKNDQRMKYYDIFDPRARYTYEAVTTSPAMTIPRSGGRAQAYFGKFEDEKGVRLHGGENYIIRIEKNVPASLFWSIVIYDTDTRAVIDNRETNGKGKATVGSRTPGLRRMLMVLSTCC